MRHIPDAQRRARVVARQRLDRGAVDAMDAVRAVVAMHASDPATPYLAVWARTPGAEVADLDHELYEARTLWRMHAMRRTLFVVPADEAHVAEAAAARDVAVKERRRIEGWLADEMPESEVAAWMRHVEEQVVTVLADGEPRRTQELSVLVPELSTEVTLGTGRWSTRSPVSSRVLFLLAMEGHIVRARPAGSWRSSQFLWAATSTWFRHRLPDEVPAEDARAGLAQRYLEAYGPASLADLRWWTGWTAKDARAALARIGAVEVALDGGGTGYLLPDDDDHLDVGTADGPSVVLLPSLDPTPMGWKGREWFLGPHGDALFDRNGNAGPTVWCDGRVIGGWSQRPDGEVETALLEDPGEDGRRRVDDTAAALTTWLDGTVVVPRFRTPLEKQLSSATDRS